MLGRDIKVEIKGDCAHVFLGGEKYEFLILGDGIIPIGRNKDIEVTVFFRRHLRTYYKDELKEVWQRQFEKENINIK